MTEPDLQPDLVDSTEYFDQAFADAPLMAILRGMGTERSLALATTAWEEGVAMATITSGLSPTKPPLPTSRP